MAEKEKCDLEIRKLQSADEAHRCAQFMATAEPWLTLGQTYNDLLKLLNDSSKEVYVAIRAEEVVGFIILDLKGSFTGYIKSIGVLPGWQRTGIGSKLVAFAEERIFRESPNVFICVSSFNTGAQKFYRRLGYKLIGELKDYLVSGHAELLLRKTIAPLMEFNQEEDNVVH